MVKYSNHYLSCVMSTVFRCNLFSALTFLTPEWLRLELAATGKTLVCKISCPLFQDLLEDNKRLSQSNDAHCLNHL